MADYVNGTYMCMRNVFVHEGSSLYLDLQSQGKKQLPVYELPKPLISNNLKWHFSSPVFMNTPSESFSLHLYKQQQRENM